VYFYSHEPNEPLHVHIDKGGASAKIWIETVHLASNAGFSSKSLGDVIRLVRRHRGMLLESWHEHFGSR
jgi:hypothetical protein